MKLQIKRLHHGYINKTSTFCRFFGVSDFKILGLLIVTKQNFIPKKAKTICALLKNKHLGAF